MKTYAIFSQKHDSEIWIKLEIGTIESLDAIREAVIEQMDQDPSQERGDVECYPFWRASWEIMGGRFEPDFDFNQVMEVDWL